MKTMKQRLELCAWLLCMVVAVGVIVYSSNAQTVSTRVLGPYPGTVAANALDFSFVAGSVVSSTFVCTGNELLIAHNTGDATYTITLKSVPDQYGRTGDISSYAIGPDEYMAFKYTSTVGWRDESTGTAEFVVENAAVKYAILNIGR